MSDSKRSSSSNDAEETLCDEFDKIRVQVPDDPDEVIAKGKPARQRASVTTCQEETKEKLKGLLMQRRPIDFSVDLKTLDTPLHRFLEAPDNFHKPSDALAKELSQMLTELEKLGFLSVYVNMPNKWMRTPLSLCLRSDCMADLISPLVRCGAQLHHLCGDLRERCNHLHYAMLKSTPRVINAILDEVSRLHPFGADGMYAMNQRHETPKASLQRRIQQNLGDPQLHSELCLILDRIQGYPPVEGMPQLQ